MSRTDQELAGLRVPTYADRLRAVTDALRLVWNGADPSVSQPIGQFSSSLLTGDAPHQLYAEVSVALDIARFLLDVETVEEAS